LAKKTIYFSLDIEASGPIPGPWWMCSFAFCRADDVSIAFHRDLQPLVLDGVSQPDRPSAMKIVAQGAEFNWDPHRPDEENVAGLRRHYEEVGIPPRDALLHCREWFAEQCGKNRAVLVGSPVTFDFMWIYWYWWHLLDEMPPFGFSGLDIRSYFMGSHGTDFLGTGKQRYLKHYPNDFEHTHHALDDARQQGQIWQDMVRARQARGG
jgi:hypothetical protein